jgi:hypothetical protein
MTRTFLPDAALAQHVAILGKTGAGKTWAARGIVESLLDSGRRVCVIDPKGDWWGLRLAKSGKSAGYSVVIFGGQHGDLPINAQSGATIAELVATGNRPAILDLSELTFNNALGRLRTLEAAEGYARDGGAMAAGVFFE